MANSNFSNDYYYELENYFSAKDGAKRAQMIALAGIKKKNIQSGPDFP